MVRCRGVSGVLVVGTLGAMATSAAKPYSSTATWRFSTRRGGHTRETPLALEWEPNGASISDNWLPDEIDARDLWRTWVEWLHDKGFDSELGAPWVRIDWFVQGEVTFESAPFAYLPTDWPGTREDFLAHYTWPVDVATGERVNFVRLPVIDKRWTQRRSNKGGFIQEALGWKPGALQPAMNVKAMAAAAGLWWPSR